MDSLLKSSTGHEGSNTAGHVSESAVSSSFNNLRNSAVARLLMEGTYPGHSPPGNGARPSHANIKIKVERETSELNDHDEECIQSTPDTCISTSDTDVTLTVQPLSDTPVDSDDLDSCDNGNGIEGRQTEVSSTASSSQGASMDQQHASDSAAKDKEQSVWQCRYCTFSTGERSSMYSHIKMHLNLKQAMNSSKPSPQITHSALYDILADKSDSQDNDRQSLYSPANSTSSHCSTSVDSSLTPAQPQNSASNYLKSIVRTILKKKRTSDDDDDDEESSSKYYSTPHSKSAQKSRTPKRKRTGEDECWTMTLDENEAAHLQNSMVKTSTGITVSPYGTRSKNSNYMQGKLSHINRDDLMDDSPDEQELVLPTVKIKQEPEDLEYQQTYDVPKENETAKIAYHASNHYDKHAPSGQIYPTQLFQKESISAGSPHVAALLQMDRLSLPGRQVPQFSMVEEPTHQDVKQSDTAVQCTLLTDTYCTKCRNTASDSSLTEPVCSQSGDAVFTTRKCDYCGIVFDDEVLYSIHMGCHSHVDPFMCNVCGRSCENKYMFYTHIMRGHQHA